jgi:hypothetical protein
MWFLAISDIREGKNNCNRRSLRDDKQKNGQQQRQLRPQIPLLRCGMTNKRTGNGNLRSLAMAINKRYTEARATASAE